MVGRWTLSELFSMMSWLTQFSKSLSVDEEVRISSLGLNIGSVFLQSSQLITSHAQLISSLTKVILGESRVQSVQRWRRIGKQSNRYKLLAR
jgi:hypothetical protein